MKKTLVFLGALLLLMIPTVALAETEGTTPTPAPATTTLAPTVRPRTMLTPEEQALRAEIAEGRQTLKTLQAQATALSQENKALGQQVKAGLQAVKTGTNTPALPERIAELLETLKQLRASMEATSGQVRQSMQASRASIAAKDFAAAKTSVNQAISVLESRIALKQQVNTALKELVALLG
ncbi:MAG: hypothetical protein Q8S22_09240 [Eubacteriales bacterium]|jgi:uncharacterized phage infection (PIP) family protein YhgE|nr:hypothetical protein [Eubacteriales bacterium]